MSSPLRTPPAAGVDLAFMRRLAPLRALYARLLRVSLVGLERIPGGPALLVGNHCGGLSSPEAVLFTLSWYERTGYREPLTLLGHDVFFRLPGVRALARRVGALPAARLHAERALRAGGKVLVFPGGDHEAFRPSADRDLIDFDGRRGFVALALRTGAPIVPVVTAGAHDIFHVVARGERVARSLRLDRWLRVKILPLTLTLPYGLTLGPPLPFLPFPCEVRIEVLDPLHLDGDPDDPLAVAAGYREVTGRMQRALTELARGLPGRPR